MADTSLLEVARQTHEETERYQQSLVDLLISSSSSQLTHKAKLKRAHQASDLLDRITSRYSYLHDFYKDATGERAAELEAISSRQNQDDVMDEFNSRIKRIKQYHEKYPGSLPDTFAVDIDSNSPSAADLDATGIDSIDRIFSGEEMAGRFLDLYLHHEAYLNLKGGVPRNTYLDYIDTFDKLVGPSCRIPKETKKSEAYRAYLHALQRYLSSFLRKSQPLANIDAIETTALAKFESEWEAGTVAGWEEKGEKLNVTDKGKQPEGDGIWCEACRRFYSKQTVYDAHLTSPKHQKAAARLKAGTTTAAAPSVDQTGKGQADSEKRQARFKAIAREEVLVMALGHYLESIRADTRTNVERKAALTDRERQAEAEAAEEELNRMSALNPTSGLDGSASTDPNGEDDDDAAGKVYNPLKLPLGWDGRPIPYWLYKLHGLGQDFQCEICSDFVYQGRKNFEKHFQESRHAFGMRALGLPNTVQFRDVTKIADALALAEKLRKQGRLQNDSNNDAEEVEDEHGNAYSKKTYELLKRQGLL